MKKLPLLCWSLRHTWDNPSNLFSVFLVCCYALPCIPLTSLYPFYHHCSPMPQGICMPIFCSLANHSSVWFVVDGYKLVSVAFWLFGLLLHHAFISIFHLHASLLLISRSFQCMVCGRWVEIGFCCFLIFLVCCYTLCIYFYLSFCMPVFCSTADHSSAWFVVDGQKMVSAAFWFFQFVPMLCFALHSILSSICILGFANNLIILLYHSR